MIYQAIPSSGKTFLARMYPLKFVDGDAIIQAVTGQKASAAALDLIVNTPALKAQAYRMVRSLNASTTHLLANFDAGHHFFPCRVDARFAYMPQDYLAHIRLVGRTDLIEKVGELELLRWAKSYEKYDNTIWLHPDQTLDDGFRFLAQQRVREHRDAFLLDDNRIPRW